MTALVQHELGPFTVDDWHALPAREDGSRLELLEGYWPDNSWFEQQQKLNSFARAGVPFFWSVSQDERGPTQLVAHRLENSQYVPEGTVKAGDGAVTVTASPVPVDIDVSNLRL